MDLSDSPEQARYRETVRAWLAEHRDEAPRRRAAATRTRRYIAARRRWQGELAEGGLAGVTWPAEYGGQGLGPIEHVIVNQEISAAGVPGILDTIGVGHARPDAHRPRDRRPEGALPRPDAARRRGLVPAVLRARRGLGPRRDPGPRAAPGGRLVAAQRAEGVDDERPVRLVRAAARAHRPRRAQAQGPDDVRRADGRARRDRPRPASDLGRGRVQRGLLRRRAPRCRRRRRPGRRRLADRAHDAHVRAPHDRPRHRGPRLQGGPLRARRSPPTRPRAATRRSAAASARSRPTSSR